MLGELAKAKSKWTIHRYASDKDYAEGNCYRVSEFGPNVLLNVGIMELMQLLCGGGGTAFNNGNAYLGVGESDTAAAAAQTALQGSTKTWKAMAASYPTTVDQTITFRSVFGSEDANIAWEEFTVVNAGSDSQGVNLNRKCSSEGTKSSGQTWTLDLAITWS